MKTKIVKQVSRVLVLLTLAFTLSGPSCEAADFLTIRPPLGLPASLPVPATNPLTWEKIQLGRRLFFDPTLSNNGTMSCALCHIPTQGFTVNEARVAVGIGGQTTRRNSQSLYNAAYHQALFYDGREFTLEDQVLGPLTHPVEMGNPSIGVVIHKLQQRSDYVQQFRQAFGEEVSAATLGKALASYERTLLSGNSPFDRWYYAGEKGVVSEEVKQGFLLFTGKGRCQQCHVISPDAALFTDGQFHNTGVAQLSIASSASPTVRVLQRSGPFSPGTQHKTTVASISYDLGRYEVTQDPADRWRYRTPSLRNVALTAPYMHNGGFSSLDEVIDYYSQGGAGAPGQDERLLPLHFTGEEKRALVAFLRSLTGDNVQLLAQENATTSQ